jgi:hypothetical protein
MLKVLEITKILVNVKTVTAIVLGSAIVSIILTYGYFAIVPMSVNKTFSSTSLKASTYNLAINKPIYGFKIEGSVQLKNENNGLTRVILIDSNKNEYLVFESYSLSSNGLSFNINSNLNNDCSETCKLNGITPAKLRIETQNAAVTLKNFTYSDSAEATKSVNDKAVKNKIEGDKIKAISENIKKRGLLWTAGETSVSKLSYSEKKKLFAKSDGTPVDVLPDLQGFEYYKGGFFEFRTENPVKATKAAVVSSSSLPEKWDWRNVHGKNFLTPIKYQGLVGTCWAFATVGSFESQINLYYNQNLNLDLSEQQLADSICYKTDQDRYEDSSDYCGVARECSGLGCLYTTKGIVGEACDPYAELDSGCRKDRLCSNWQLKGWKASGAEVFNFDPKRGHWMCPYDDANNMSIDDLKNVLIKKGPLRVNVAWSNPPHAMVLIGYGKVTADNVYAHIEPDQYGMQVEWRLGQNYWIFKNSWGEDWGENGFGKVILFDVDKKFIDLERAFGPFFPPSGQSYQTVCEDKDGDGYYNWGSGDDRSTCPYSAKLKYYKDADDGNPNIKCIPYCVGLTCGSDGCGGTCGTCSGTNLCVNGKCSVPSAACVSGQQIGDVNHDFAVDQADREMIADIKVGLIPKPANACCADVNNDGRIDSADGIVIDQIMKRLAPMPGKCN